MTTSKSGAGQSSQSLVWDSISEIKVQWDWNIRLFNMQSAWFSGCCDLIRPISPSLVVLSDDLQRKIPQSDSLSELAIREKPRQSSALLCTFCCHESQYHLSRAKLDGWLKGANFQDLKSNMEPKFVHQCTSQSSSNLKFSLFHLQSVWKLKTRKESRKYRVWYESRPRRSNERKQAGRYTSTQIDKDLLL